MNSDKTQIKVSKEDIKTMADIWLEGYMHDYNKKYVDGMLSSRQHELLEKKAGEHAIEYAKLQRYKINGGSKDE